MIKKELNDFKITLLGKEKLSKVPFSLYSELGVNDTVEDQEVIFSTIFEVDSLAEEGFFLKVYNLEAGEKILINGSEIYRTEVKRRSAVIDIKPKLTIGENSLEMRIKGAACDAGILRAPEIMRTRFAVISDIKITQKNEQGKASISIKLDTLGVSESVRAVATLVSGAGQIYYSGLIGGKGTITVNDPLYWWPKGLGVQNLYRLTITIYGNMEIEDSLEMRIGIRELTTAKSADGSLLEANGASIVPMGATYRPEGKHNPSVLKKAQEASLAEAAKCGFNTIVIPADAGFPDEHFLGLCDAYGIVVIRETADVNADEMLLAQSSHHPCIGIVDIVGAGDKIAEAAEKLHTINPIFEFSEEEKAVSYVGASSLPCYKTILSDIPDEEKNPFSRAVESDAGEDMSAMLIDIGREYLYPSDILDFAYASQLCAAQKAACSIVSARIDRGNAGRAVVSELACLNSIVSRAVLDKNCRPKAAIYKMSKLFAPITAFVSINNSTAAFMVSNESRRPYIGVLEYKILDSENNLIHRREESCVIESAQTKLVFAHDLSQWISGREQNCYLEYTLREGNGILACGTELFVPAKRFCFKNPHIEADIIGDDHRFTITLSSKAYARFVEIDFDGFETALYDNYIDITSTAPIKISFTVLGKSTTAEHLKSALKIRSVYDIGR